MLLLEYMFLFSPNSKELPTEYNLFQFYLCKLWHHFLLYQVLCRRTDQSCKVRLHYFCYLHYFNQWCIQVAYRCIHNPVRTLRYWSECFCGLTLVPMFLKWWATKPEIYRSPALKTRSKKELPCIVFTLLHLNLSK